MPVTFRKSFPALLVALIIYSFVYLLGVRPLITVQVVDYWDHLAKAANLSLAEPASLVDPFLSLGYLALLRVGLALGTDMVRYGQFLSWLGSILCLVGTYTIVYSTSKKNFYALLSVLLLVAHPIFRFQAMREGSDILAAGLQMITVAILFISLESKQFNWLLVAAGIMLGLGYLVRTTSLVLVPTILFTIWLMTKRFDKRTLISILLFLTAFLVTIAPQMIASLMTENTPFYNQQARNVWFGIYGQFNWLENWQKIPPNITLQQIITADPVVFVKHIITEFGRLFKYQSGYGLDLLGFERNVSLWNPLILHIAWLASCLFLWWDKRIATWQKALLTLALFVPILVTSMAWLFTRFLILALALQVVIIILALTQLGDRFVPAQRRPWVVGSLTFGLLALFLLTTHWDFKAANVVEMANRNIEVNGLLASSGATSPTEVLSNNRLFQLVDPDLHDRFGILGSPGMPGAVQELEPYLRDNPGKYLLFDWSPRAIRDLDLSPYAARLRQAKPALIPLHIAPEFELYCQYPCLEPYPIAPPIPVQDGLRLIGYRAFTAQDGGEQGIFLYWTTDEKLTTNYIVALSLYDGKGELLDRVSNQPQQDTYPTSEWETTVSVIDFYRLNAESSLAGVGYTLEISLGSVDGTEIGQPEAKIPVRFETSPLFSNQ